ncbi:MAG TPA: M20 family metallopeptidase, partial [Flavobacteriales bacterium]|nr:M20 family metallopeptidase [Flavobacteriales bacterium]
MAEALTVERVQRLVKMGHMDAVEVRRQLHMQPELSFQEHETGRYIAERLRGYGIETRTGIAGTGVIGVVHGAKPGPTVCLRADMDALPIQEAEGLPYRSMNPGVMHACGHDAHTAMVLAAGRILHQLRADWRGTGLLLFQPGEEKIPGGASIVLEEGALKDPVPGGILGQHVTPELEVGKVGFHAGPFMASSDELYLTVKGKGGHAAQPEKLIAPIQIAARLLIVLKDECKAWAGSRPLVLGFGRVLADG